MQFAPITVTTAGTEAEPDLHTIGKRGL